MIATASTVYGPVISWRYGRSLGIDPILERSACTFDCVYCQLGGIGERTAERRVFVPTARILEDAEGVDPSSCDVVTVSGSGEPTLAANLGEALRELRARIDRPAIVLTNGSLLARPDVRRDLEAADVVSVKLDAGFEDTFRRLSRPVPGVTLRGVVEGLRRYAAGRTNRLHLQVMLLPANRREAEAIALLARSVRPDEIELSTPRRPRPSRWYLEARGSHGPTPYPARPVRCVEDEDLERFALLLECKSGIPVTRRTAGRDRGSPPTG